jgi:hypothetical protein
MGTQQIGTANALEKALFWSHFIRLQEPSKEQTWALIHQP